MRELSLESRFPNFGKYRDHPAGPLLTLRRVCEMDAQYVRWCIHKIDWFRVDREAFEFLLDCPTNDAWDTEDAPCMSAGDVS